MGTSASRKGDLAHPEDAVMSGPLLRSHGKRFEEKFFVLTEEHLWHFHRQSSRRIAGVINLVQVEQVTLGSGAEGEEDGSFSLLIEGDRAVTLCASDSEQTALWFAAIAKQVDVAHHRASFKEFDHNGDGVISRGELEGVLANLFGVVPGPRDVDRLMKQVDTNGDGFIDFSEFVTMMTQNPRLDEHGTLVLGATTPFFAHSYEACKAAFDALDADGDGHICEEELRNILREFDFGLGEVEIENMIAQADFDGDNKVSFGEFLHIMNLD